MDYEISRELVHELLRSMLIRAKSNPRYENQYRSDMQRNTVATRVRSLAIERGYISPSDSWSQSDEKSITQTLWELINNGMLMPVNSSGESGWPSICLTDFGESWILQEEFVPYDPSGYLARLKDSCPNLDDIVEFYLGESLACLRAGRFPACAVMLGVASERLFDILLDSLMVALKSSTEAAALRTKTRGRMIGTRYLELKKILDPKKNQLPTELRERLEWNLVSIFNLVRYTRNDGGHPAMITVTKEESSSNVQVFGRYCEYMYSLINYLDNHQAQL